MSLREGEMVIASVLVMRVEVLIGGDHPIAAVRISHGDRNGPGDGGVMGEVLIGVPGDIVRGVADVKDRREQKRQIATARADNEVRLRESTGKSDLCGVAETVNADEEHDGKGYGKDGE
jgi:hypothetical protein